MASKTLELTLLIFADQKKKKNCSCCLCGNHSKPVNVINIKINDPNAKVAVQTLLKERDRDCT